MTEKTCVNCKHYGGGNWLDPAGFYCSKKGKWLDDYNPVTDSYDTSPAISCPSYEEAEG